MKTLTDSFGRKFPYIRLSITDVCNYKCTYCLPQGYKKTPGDTRSFMSGEEISRLTKALSELGVCKIRLTGGEPTVRKDFFDILKDMKQNSNIPKITMTTNGYRLNKIAKQLYELGLDGINISIDNLDYFKKNHVSSKIFRDYLENNNWIYQTFGKDAGPSLNFIHPEYKGKFGLIAPYSKDFCKTCNRLRITSRGDLRLCLFGNTGISIRHLLQNDDQKNELVDLILKQLHLKKESHYLELGDTGLTKNLSTTGG